MKGRLGLTVGTSGRCGHRVRVRANEPLILATKVIALTGHVLSRDFSHPYVVLDGGQLSFISSEVIEKKTTPIRSSYFENPLLVVWMESNHVQYPSAVKVVEALMSLRIPQFRMSVISTKWNLRPSFGSVSSLPVFTCPCNVRRVNVLQLGRSTWVPERP